MLKFILTRPKSVFFKRNGVEHADKIATIGVLPLSGDPDEVELAARESLVRSATYEDGRSIAIQDLEVWT